jgi:hypothetical protein
MAGKKAASYWCWALRKNSGKIETDYLRFINSRKREKSIIMGIYYLIILSR